jgi:hypothetical protein
MPETTWREALERMEGRINDRFSRLEGEVVAMRADLVSLKEERAATHAAVRAVLWFGAVVASLGAAAWAVFAHFHQK